MKCSSGSQVDPHTSNCVEKTNNINISINALNRQTVYNNKQTNKKRYACIFIFFPQRPAQSSQVLLLLLLDVGFQSLRDPYASHCAHGDELRVHSRVNELELQGHRPGALERKVRHHQAYPKGSHGLELVMRNPPLPLQELVALVPLHRLPEAPLQIPPKNRPTSRALSRTPRGSHGAGARTETPSWNSKGDARQPSPVPFSPSVHRSCSQGPFLSSLSLTSPAWEKPE
mmetsp:Transcript_4565/g.13585  ORF Transcript_4565/g.13585 Transcript_4565/m.13585 type:complete len:229 (+) Transcript_4565:327-1013(+)